MREYIPYSKSCFVCGEENPLGFRLEFYKEGNEVRAEVVIPEHFIGYKGYAHGGIVSALLDEAMSWAASIFGGERLLYMTVEINVRFKKPVPVGKKLLLRGWVADKKRSLVYTESSLSLEGTELASGKGKFLPAPIEAKKEYKEELRYGRCRSFKGFFDNLFREVD